MLSAEVRHRRVLPALAVATTAGVAAALLVAVAARLTGEELVVLGGAGLQPVPLGAVAAAGAVSGPVAGLLAALVRRLARPRRSFLMVTAAGVLLSAVPPIQAAQSTPTALWLLAMHVVVAAAIIPAVAVRLSPTGPMNARSPVDAGSAAPRTTDTGR